MGKARGKRGRPRRSARARVKIGRGFEGRGRRGERE